MIIALVSVPGKSGEGSFWRLMDEGLCFTITVPFQCHNCAYSLCLLCVTASVLAIYVLAIYVHEVYELKISAMCRSS